MDVTSKSSKKYGGEVVGVGSEGHGESGLSRYEMAEIGKGRMESRFTAAEANTETTESINFKKPSADESGIEHRRCFRGVAVWTLQVTCIRKRDGNLTGRDRPIFR